MSAKWEVNLKMLILKTSLLILLLSSIATCANQAKQDETKEPELVEVAEYEGIKLSSIDDFIENSIKGLQYVDKDRFRLEITGLVNSPKKYAYNEITDRQSYRKAATLNCVEGWSVTILWEGVLVKDLLKEAGVDSTAKIVIFYAHDGYSTSFPLDYIMENDIIMAYKMNELTLPPKRGFPFQLVAENKWGYKWIKWITKIELSDNEEHRGFWESRGYSNDADLDKSFFEEP